MCPKGTIKFGIKVELKPEHSQNTCPYNTGNISTVIALKSMEVCSFGQESCILRGMETFHISNFFSQGLDIC